jgi:hypothetical protein
MEIHKGAILYIHEFHPIFFPLLSPVTQIIPSVITETSILQKEKLKLVHFCGSYRERKKILQTQRQRRPHSAKQFYYELADPTDLVLSKSQYLS